MKIKWVFYFVGLVLLFQCTERSNNTIGVKCNTTAFEVNISSNFPELPIPEDNPMTVEGIDLGRKLFYDPILSGDSTQSCASCHQQKYAFGDNKRFSKGMDDLDGERNSPPIINIGWGTNLFWDGRAEGLEEQALGPVENPIEMHDSWDNVVMKIQRSNTYRELFIKAFGLAKITKEMVAKAISQFERTLISQDSKYDRVIRKEENFTEQELRGLNLFFTERADCFHCHGNILFTDVIFHNSGLDKTFKDTGKEKVSGRKRDRGKFKTPTLRNLVFTAPYMHDGRFSTLEEVVEFYSEGVQNSETVDPLMKNVHRGGVQLTNDEKVDLIAFLHTLSDSSFVKNPAFSNPFK